MNDKKIRIHYDPQGIEDVQDPSTIVIYGIFDYIKGYKLVVDCIKSKNSAKIIVHDATAFAWLRRISEKYTETTFEVKEIRPCTLLAEKFGFIVPSDVTDEEVVELNLLDFQVEKGLSFTDFILSKFVSPIMCSEAMPQENLSNLTAAICKDEIQVSLQKRLIQREFERKIENWLKNAKSEHEKEVIELLLENPKELKRVLSLYAVLANYPKEVGERAAGKILNSIRSIGVIPSSIKIDSADTDTAFSNIEIFINTEFKNGISQFDALKIIEWASGLVPEEFGILAKTLEQSPNVLTIEVLKSLEKKFSDVLQEIQPELRKLSLQLKPSIPKPPESSWDAAKMLEWAIQQYLPYHFWLEETNNEDSEVSNQSELFSDWLFSNFVNIRSNFPNIVYRVLPNIMSMHTTDKCVLILVIDNFNYKYADVLTSLLQIHGLRLVQKIPYFSMVPSDTEVSKRCLFAGQPKASEVLLDYDSLVSSEWQRYFPDRHFVYLKSSVDLESTQASVGDVIFVNCTQIDSVLHQDERKLGKRHSVAVEAELKNLADLASGFFNQNALTNNALIIICSDHGSTMIPSKTQNEIDSTFFADKALDTHHRFISISREEYERLPTNIRFQCYFLDSASFGLSENVLVAKAYYRFRRTTEHFFVHGGLSPEETIVPFVVLEGGMPAFKEPNIRLLQNEFRYLTKANVEIEIINENSAPLEDMRIVLVSEGVETIEPIPLIQKIDPAGLFKTSFHCRFYKHFDTTKGLEITFEFKFLGKTYAMRRTFTVQMKSLMETSFKLSELP
jgi:GTPase SAR1 family protein